MSFSRCVLLVAMAVLAACDAPAPAPKTSAPLTTYEVHGTLREKRAEGRRAVIAHEAIPGYMEAMTMEFEAADLAELSGLQPGDTLTFRLSVTDTRGWIDQVKKTGHSPIKITTTPAPALTAPVILPECELVDQRGEKLRLSDFKGRALAITFIYTRCPYPDFCPRMSDRFAAVQRQLTDDRCHLLSITVDPEHDTPERLAEYARRYSADAAHWTFATGDPAEIQKLAEPFGVVVMRDGAQWNHNLRTAVIDPHGRVQNVFTGNEWKAEELVAELNRVLNPVP